MEGFAFWNDVPQKVFDLKAVLGMWSIDTCSETEIHSNIIIENSQFFLLLYDVAI